jgi:hypothetical protein
VTSKNLLHLLLIVVVWTISQVHQSIALANGFTMKAIKSKPMVEHTKRSEYDLASDRERAVKIDNRVSL